MPFSCSCSFVSSSVCFLWINIYQFCITLYFLLVYRNVRKCFERLITLMDQLMICAKGCKHDVLLQLICNCYCLFEFNISFNGFSFTRKHLNLLLLALKCPFGVTLTYFNKN